MAKSNFRLTPLYHWVWVVGGLSLMGVMSVSPTSVPYSSLGLVGTFLHYLAYDLAMLIQLGFFVAMMVHLIEGSVAFVMCRRMNLSTRDTLLWTTQTLMLGFTSLLPLRAKYKKMKKAQ